MKMVVEEEIDAYIADTQFRKRDPRFADVDKYKECARKERAGYYGTSGLYRAKEFTLSEDRRFCICPAGKRLITLQKFTDTQKDLHEVIQRDRDV